MDRKNVSWLILCKLIGSILYTNAIAIISALEFSLAFSGTVNETTYKDYDECDPEKFPIDACPKVECMFYKYGPSNEALYMQVHNHGFIILPNYV